MQTPVQPRPAEDADPGAAFRLASRQLVQNQGRTIAVALSMAALIFLGLTIKNLLDGFIAVGAICALAVLICLLYAHSFTARRPAPISDGILVAIALIMTAIVVGERGLTGVLWCYPLILFFYLVADPIPARAFNAGTVLIATGLIYLQHDGLIAFRVGATLAIGSVFAVIYTNILRAHQARQQEQHRRLDLLLRCSNLGAYEWHAPTRVVDVSPRLRTMLGYPEDADTTGWTIGQFVHEEDRARVEHTFNRLMEERGLPGSMQQTAPLDFRMQQRDGSTAWVHVDAIAIAGADGRTEKLIASFLDITPLKRAEESTRSALQREQELNELRSRFVAMTSHEFRTPLAAILSSAELLKLYGDRLPGDEKSALLETVDDSVQRMTQMLDRILLISKAEARMLEFKPLTIDPVALCRKVIEDVGRRHPETPCEIMLQPSWISRGQAYDEKLLRHILENLLSNAVKYSPAGGTVRLGVISEADATVFQVSDEGIGIPNADRDNLFTSFHRASNVGDIRGTGLGLSIVKVSVELHGGRITVDSIENKGSRFTVRLPDVTVTGEAAVAESISV